MADLENQAVPMLSRDNAKKALASAQKAVQGFSATWTTLFLAAAGCVIAAGTLSVIELTFAVLQPFDLISSMYLLMFGLMMLTVDFPASFTAAQKYKSLMMKYFLFMTRFTGRGAWYLFLGCMTFATLWNNSISGVLSFALGGYVAAVGGLCLFVGIKRSAKLDKLRQALRSRVHADGKPEDYCPSVGMTRVQFQQLAEGMKFQFTQDEVTYIFNALSPRVDHVSTISLPDFQYWVSPGPMTVL